MFPIFDIRHLSPGSAKNLTIILLLVSGIILSSCATSYRIINPTTLHYTSQNTEKNVGMEYRYHLLYKKYTSKEINKGIRLIAVKITNNTNKDLIFGKDINLEFEEGNDLRILDQEKVFKELKQNVAPYLFYLVLTPFVINTHQTNSSGVQEVKGSIPVGPVLGPGLAFGNIIAGSSANKRFKSELTQYNISGLTILKGETVYGLVGIKASKFGPIKIKWE